MPSNPPEGVVTAAVDMPWSANILATAATGVSGGIFVTFVAIRSRAYSVCIAFPSPLWRHALPTQGINYSSYAGELQLGRSKAAEFSFIGSG
jgi:hypothetical protein